MIVLKADLESGEGSIKVPEKFNSESPLMRADLLKDWIYDLEKEYEKAKADMGQEFERHRKAV